MSVVWLRQMLEVECMWCYIDGAWLKGDPAIS